MRTFLYISVAALLAATTVVAIRSSDELTPEVTADRIVVDKSDRQLLLFANDRLLKTYTIALGSEPVGHKRQEGDGRTPEGDYVIDYRNPQSRYYLSLHVSYPDAEDRERAAGGGVSPGGDIFIHGLPPKFAWIGSGHTVSDWTDGCIAVTNDEIEELWRAVPNGTPIVIEP